MIGLWDPGPVCNGRAGMDSGWNLWTESSEGGMCWSWDWFHRQQVIAPWSRCCSQGTLGLWIWSFHWSICPAGCFSAIKQTWTMKLSGIRWCSSIWVCLQESSSCVIPCVGYRLGYTVILWITEKSEREPFILLPPPLSILVREEPNGSVTSATEGTLVALHHMMWLQCLFPAAHTTPVPTTLSSRAVGGLQEAFCCSLTKPAVAVVQCVLSPFCFPE